MSVENTSRSGQYQLSIELEAGSVPVSYLSSVLRVLQAALREVAMSNDAARVEFDTRPQPMLMLSSLESNGAVKIRLRFVDPQGMFPLDDLSSQTFTSFMDRFIEFVNSLPQPGLWGGTPSRLPRQAHRSRLLGRMDQVHRELRRSSKVAIRFRDRFVEIEGDRMEIG